MQRFMLFSEKEVKHKKKQRTQRRTKCPAGSQRKSSGNNHTQNAKKVYKKNASRRTILPTPQNKNRQTLTWAFLVVHADKHRDCNKHVFFTKWFGITHVYNTGITRFVI